MTLQSQNIEVPFAKGVDQKSAPEWVERGSQTSVINGSWAKNGSLRKRFGSSAVSKQSISAAGNSIALTNGATLEAYKNSFAVSDGSDLYTYSVAKNALIHQDKLPECIALRTPLAQSTVGVVSADCAATNGYACYAFRATDVTGATNNYVTIVDLSTNAQIGANTIIATSTKVGLRCFALGTDFWVVWTDSSNVIKASRFQTAGSFTWGAAVTLASNQSATATQGCWDVSPVTGQSAFMLVYQDNQSTNHVRAGRYDSTGTIQNSADFPIGSGSLPVAGIAVRSTNGETCWVAYVTTNGANTDFVRAIGLDPFTLVFTVADTLLYSGTPLGSRHVGVERVSSTIAVVVSSLGAGDAQWQQINTSAALVGPTRTQPSWQMWSKPFAQGGKVYCGFWHYSDSINQTFEVVDLQVANIDILNDVRARPVATIAPRIASLVTGMDTLVSTNVASIGNSQFIMPVTVSVSTSRDSVWQCVLDFASQQRHQAVELGDCMYLAGGVPSIFDGAQVTEHGFTFPPPTASNITVSAGGSIDVGGHQYAIVYKWVNARGEMQRSAPLFTGVVTTSGGNQTVNIPILPYGLTTKQDPENAWSPAVTFDVYRNTIIDPATWWQLKSDSTETASDPRTATAVTVVDTLSDTAIITNAIGILYTLGGVAAEQCPPSLTCLTVHRNRIWGVGDDGTTLWFTKQYNPGFTPGFNDVFTLACPDGGQVTGLASMDDTLVVFKRDRIFRLSGTGPNNANQNSDFSDFIRVASDTGCTQSRSIVLGPQGTFFLSPQGIYLLSRGGESMYVGKAVEDTVAANPVCFAADIVASRGEVRWSLAPSLASTTGVIVKYDYVQDAWSVDQYYDTDAAVASAVARGVRAPGGNWAWLGKGGSLNIESSSSYLDGGSQWVTLSVESAWVKANGIGGWGRFKRAYAAMEQASPFTLTMSVASEFNPTYTQPTTWLDTQIAQRFTPLVELDIHIGNQKSQAVRIKLSDAPPTTAAVGTGQGPVFLGMSLDVGIMAGNKGKRLPAIQRG